MQIPLYKKVKDDLKTQILKGIYSEGDLLPSENELCGLYSINRSTVRQALNEMVVEGYISKQHGKGSIVNNRNQSLGLLSIKGFSQIVSSRNEKVNSIMLEKPIVMKWADDFFYDISDIARTAGCIYFKRIRFVDEMPIMLEQTFIPNLNISRFCNTSFVNDSLFDTLSINYNIEIRDVEQDMRAVLADSENAKLLNVKKGSPLLHLYLKFRTNREHLFIYSSLLCNTEKYSISNVK